MSTTSDLSRSAKRHVNKLGTQAKEAATQEAVAQADALKNAAAKRVQDAADAAEAAAREFDANSPQTQAIHQVADHIEDVATRLRTADVRHLADQATSMARRNPALFVGGAAILGFAAARFLKARGPQTAAAHHDHDPWAVPASRGYAPSGSIGGQTDV